MEKTYVLEIAAVEDEPKDAALLKTYIEKSGIPSRLEMFKSGDEFLRSFSAGRYNLVFLDIYLSGTTGVHVAKTIRQADTNVVLAFTTLSLDHTLDSYRVGALKYLEKPLKEEAVREALEIALGKLKSRPQFAFLLKGGKRADIPLDSILYFEKKGHIVAAYTPAGFFKSSRTFTLDDVEKMLPSPPFLRCHRSYLVNLDYVVKVDKELHAFIMQNGDRTDIKRGFLGQYTETLKLWMLERTKEK